MKITFTSDLHGNLPEIDPCDVLVIAGDICPHGPDGIYPRENDAAWQSGWLDSVFREWLGNVPAGHVVAIWGNHDFVGDVTRFGSMPPPLPWTLLQDSSVEIGGVKFYGTAWVPGLPRWAFHISDAALMARAGAIPRDTDILVSHGPPYGVADFVDPQYGSVHVGDRALKGSLNTDLKPKLFVCGHIHEQYGQHFVPGEEPVEVWNVSHVNTSYEPVNAPMTLEL